MSDDAERPLTDAASWKQQLIKETLDQALLAGTNPDCVSTMTTPDSGKTTKVIKRMVQMGLKA